MGLFLFSRTSTYLRFMTKFSCAPFFLFPYYFLCIYVLAISTHRGLVTTWKRKKYTMAQHERLPRPRRSLHTDTPVKVKARNVHPDEDEEDKITEVGKADAVADTITDTVTGNVQEVVVQPRRQRPPRTYGRKRAGDETSALLAARSATVSLETRNCGEGRISLCSAAVPLLALEDTTGDENSGATTSRKRAGRKRKDSEDTNKQAEEERIKLDEFMAQQKAFWEQVDDSSLLEEDSS